MSVPARFFFFFLGYGAREFGIYPLKKSKMLLAEKSKSAHKVMQQNSTSNSLSTRAQFQSPA